MTSAPEPTPPSSGKFLLELGPLVVFFGTNWAAGIYWATGAFMVAIALAITVAWKREGKVPPMMIFTGMAVALFGGLTLFLHDDTFIKIKVTILNALIGLLLLVGELAGRPLLRALLGSAFQLTERGWRILTLRYAALFLFLAGLNELVWRNVSTDAWVTFKVFGLLGATLLFSILQVPLLQRHQFAAGSEKEPAGPAGPAGH